MNYKLDKKQIYIATCVAILFIVVVAFFKFPLSHRQVGDESSYFQEVDYFARFGFFQALAQGTSLVYSLLIFAVDKIFFLGNFLVAARVLNILCFVFSAFLLFRLLHRFKGMSPAAISMSLMYFTVICSGWCWKGLPDIVSLMFLFGAMNLITGNGKKANYAIAAFFVLCAFATKPTAIFYFPALLVVTFIYSKRRSGMRNGITDALLFTGTFALCFAAYHVPGYMSYGRLMLEDKNHTYSGIQRVENKVSWNDANVYFEKYNPQHKENIWAITMEEVDSFRTAHPEMKLYEGHIAFAVNSPAKFVSNTADKIFLILPYSIQYGFFFAKWTIANRFIHSIFIVKLLSMLLIGGIFVMERKFVKDNLLLLILPLSYYVFLSLYVFAQMQDNWILCCLPLLAIPVARFLAGKIHIVQLLLLQAIYILL
jgi:hypothetical protein